MLKRLEQLIESSCLSKAGPDEPIFVLRAHDKFAPMIVRVWAGIYAASKGGYALMTQRQIDKYKEAIALAHLMDEWKAENPG